MSLSSMTAFLLLSWITSAWTSWRSAFSIAFPMKSACTGSSRPLTSMTLIGGTFGASCARAGCAKNNVAAATAPRAAHTLDSLRNRASEGGWLDPLAFFATSRLVIVAGKGGVGKTTVTAALAVAAAKSGLRVLAVEVEGKTGLARLFGVDALRYDETAVLESAGSGGSGRILARAITPTDALLEYLVDHGMRRLSNRLVRGGALDVVATAAPGIEDILVLGKVKQLERGGAVDLVLLDAPAAGHAITFLESARGLLDAVTVGPIHTQANDVMEMLTDPERCSVVLVTLPEETPVNELVDTAYSLEDRVGVSLGPVVVNGLYPERPGMHVDPVAAADEARVTLMPGEAETLREAAKFRTARVALQTEQLARLSERLPLPQIHLPFLFTTDLSNEDIHALGDAALEAIGVLGPMPA